jgi:hypothetical protein
MTELKLLVTYNIRPTREAEYYRFVLGEFLPKLQNLGMIMSEGWHTSYGNYPARLLVFRTQEDTNMQGILKSAAWRDGKDTLLRLVTDYEERLVVAKNSFQFFLPTEN